MGEMIKSIHNFNRNPWRKDTTWKTSVYIGR